MQDISVALQSNIGATMLAVVAVTSLLFTVIGVYYKRRVATHPRVYFATLEEQLFGHELATSSVPTDSSIGAEPIQDRLTRSRIAVWHSSGNALLENHNPDLNPFRFSWKDGRVLHAAIVSDSGAECEFRLEPFSSRSVAPKFTRMEQGDGLIFEIYHSSTSDVYSEGRLFRSTKVKEFQSQSLSGAGLQETKLPFWRRYRARRNLVIAQTVVAAILASLLVVSNAFLFPEPRTLDERTFEQVRTLADQQAVFEQLMDAGHGRIVSSRSTAVLLAVYTATLWLVVAALTWTQYRGSLPRRLLEHRRDRYVVDLTSEVGFGDEGRGERAESRSGSVRNGSSGSRSGLIVRSQPSE